MRRSPTHARAASAGPCRCSPTPTASTEPGPSGRRACRVRHGRSTELTDLARRLTTRSPTARSGSWASIRSSASTRTRRPTSASMFGAQWSDATGRSSLASDPGWARMLAGRRRSSTGTATRTSSRSRRRRAGVHAGNAFQSGRLAMCLDGEWRVAFLAARGRRSRTGRARAGRPSHDRRSTGPGYINGSVIGIPAAPRSRTRLEAREVPDDR